MNVSEGASGQLLSYWLVVTSPANFSYDRDVLKFRMQGLPARVRNSVQRMQIGDRIVYYIMGLQRFGATATITGEYVEDSTKMWTDDDEMWPARRLSKADIVLEDDELIDAKKLVPSLSFVENKHNWGAHFQGSIRQIPEDDFRLIESEMKKVVAERFERDQPLKEGRDTSPPQTEEEVEAAIMSLPLETKTLHDRLGEMLEQIGSWLDYNTQTRYKITPDHAYELDVAWLSGKNPEVAIEVQISGNLTEAKDRLAHARKFNYRKVILVCRKGEMLRLNALMRHEPDLRSWMEAWSLSAIYKMYVAGESFFKYYRQLIEAVYKDKRDLELVI